MTTATYTKITKSSSFNDQSTSLGFRRWSSLPAQVRKNLGTAYILQGGAVNLHHEYMVSFFENMTAPEFKEWCLAN